MTEATQRGHREGIVPDQYIVTVEHEYRRSEDSRQVVDVYDTEYLGSFSDCCRDSRSVSLPNGRGWRTRIVRTTGRQPCRAWSPELLTA